MKIAVFLDEQGMTSPVWQAHALGLYTRDGEGWRLEKNLPVHLSPEMPLSELRERIAAIIMQLPTCRHFVAAEIHGALRAWFDGMGIAMWQGRGQPLGFLDEIAARDQPPTPAAPETPPQTALVRPGDRDGEFYLNLIEALQGGGAHTSRRLIQPLLSDAGFQRLEILCDHLPKWFNTLDASRLSVATTSLDDGTLRVVVTRQNACV